MGENDQPDEVLSVQLERVLPGPVERVWAYLRDPDLLATWLTGNEVASGGQPLQAGADAHVTRCEPPLRLEVTLRPHAAGTDRGGELHPPGSTVAFELEPRGEQVLLRVTVRRPVAEFRPQVVACHGGSATTRVPTLRVVTRPRHLLHNVWEEDAPLLRAA